MPDQDSTQQHHPQPGDQVAGDKFGGDKITGDKVAGDMIDGSVSISGGTVHGPAVGVNQGTVTYTHEEHHHPAPPTPEERAAAQLVAAQKLLASLPLDALPDVAPLPPGSRMPLSRNPLFVGRVDDMHALAATLKGGGTAAIGPITAATGLGGIGKT